MAVTPAVAARACARLFDQACALGSDLPADTPAAGFLAGAARHIDAAAVLLAGSVEQPSASDLHSAGERLSVAEATLRDVAELLTVAAGPSAGQLIVLAHGLRATLTSQTPAPEAVPEAVPGTVPGTVPGAAPGPPRRRRTDRRP